MPARTRKDAPAGPVDEDAPPVLAADTDTDTDTDAGMPVGTEPNNAEVSAEPAAEPADIAADTEPGTPEADDPGPDETVDLIVVDGPCARCFPNGWPEPALGAAASCHHAGGFTIGYGETMQVTLAQAAELGYL